MRQIIYNQEDIRNAIRDQHPDALSIDVRIIQVLKGFGSGERVESEVEVVVIVSS